MYLKETISYHIIKSITILWLMVFTFILGNGCFQLLAPNISMTSYQYNLYQSNRDYLESLDPKIKAAKQKFPESQLTQERNQKFQEALTAEQRSGLSMIITSIIGLLIGVVTLFAITKTCRRCKEEESQNTP